MTSKEALSYLDDIAHGRKMDLDPHELYCIVKKDLEVLKIIKENLNIDEILFAVKGVCKASDYDLVKEALTNE